MYRIVKRATDELFGSQTHSLRRIPNMHRSVYILGNGNTPGEKAEAFYELQDDVKRIERQGHSLRYFRRVLDSYKP